MEKKCTTYGESQRRYYQRNRDEIVRKNVERRRNELIRLREQAAELAKIKSAMGGN